MGQVRNFRLNESAIGPYPTTDVLPDNIKIGILASQGPAPAEESIDRNSPALRQDLILESSVIVVQYIVAIADKQSEQVWACHMNPIPDEDYIDVNGGTYRIEASVIPARNTVIKTDSQGFSGNECPAHAAKITFRLPLTRQATQKTYNLFFTLYQKTDHGERICASHIETIGPTVSRPVEKIRVKGALTTNFGRHWINRFRNLVDEGGYTRIGQCRKRLEDIVNEKALPQFQDVVCLAILEEADAYLTQGTMKDARETANKAFKLIAKYHSVNAPILRGYAYVVLAVADRVEGKFEEAEKHLERSCQEMEPIEACEFKCCAPYNIGTLVMDKLASGVGGVSDESERQRGRKAFANATKYCTGQCESHMLPRVQNRLVSFLLRTTPNKAPDTSLTVPAQDIERAGETLASIERDILPRYPSANWAKALFRLNKSDYYMRRGDVHEAIAEAEMFKEIAADIGGLDTKRRAAEERIQNLRPPAL